ncbi:hypothetical protein V8F33_007847 [Rhypophila sp. PSN 637]
MYLQCLALEGHVPSSSRQLRTGLEALRSNVWEWPASVSASPEHCKAGGDKKKKDIKAHKGQMGTYLQGSPSPIWDTLLMARGLMACHYRPQPGQDRPVIGRASHTLSGCATSKGKSKKKDDKIDDLVKDSLHFIRSKEIRDKDIGDWQVYRPHLPPGSYSFEYVNRWFPDVDDTAVAVLAFLKRGAEDRHLGCDLRGEKEGNGSSAKLLNGQGTGEGERREGSSAQTGISEEE